MSTMNDRAKRQSIITACLRMNELGINQGTSGASANYNSLQTKFTKHFSGKTYVDANYTWSRDLTNAQADYSGFAQDPYHLNNEYGRAADDRNNVLTFENPLGPAPHSHPDFFPRVLNARHWPVGLVLVQQFLSIAQDVGGEGKGVTILGSPCRWTSKHLILPSTAPARSLGSLPLMKGRTWSCVCTTRS